MKSNVEVFDEAMEELVDPGARPEHLAGGFSWAEGPVWNFEEGYLTFSDVIGDEIYRYDEAGGVQTYRRPSDHANGQIRDPAGRLVVCEHRTRRLTRETPEGIEPVVESYNGKSFNSPNDVVAARDGTLFFTDPAYGLDKVEEGGGGERELSFQGVYRVPSGSSGAVLISDDFVGPNGLALSPEEDLLYVVDSERAHIRSFEVGAGWGISGGEVLAEIPSGAGAPDGVKVDVRGNIFCTGEGGIWVLTDGGATLGRIRVPEVAANLAWGDEDARTLYVTASTGLYRIRCRTAGYAPHRTAA